MISIQSPLDMQLQVQELLSELITQFMTDSYWFKRSHSTTKPVETHSETFFKTNNVRQDIVLPDDSLKNHIKSAAHKLLEIAEGFNRSKRINQLLSDEVEQKGGEVRCTLHNSSIILYCINDHRLLCSVCVFSSENHKRHQLVQAAKAESFLDYDLRETEKKLRGKIVDINRQKGAWADLLRQLDKNYAKSLEDLQIEHDSAVASISSAFNKIKIKLGEIFESTRESIEILIKSYTDFAKCLKFDHPYLRVKHYYLQEVMDKKPSFDHLFPNVKTAIQNVKILDKFAKSLVKNYKNQCS